MLDWKGPVTNVVINKMKESATDIVVSYIESLPILIGVSIGVYALLNMVSNSLAKFGVAGVFVYGGLVVLI